MRAAKGPVADATGPFACPDSLSRELMTSVELIRSKPEAG
jgi:hypothetical protein